MAASVVRGPAGNNECRVYVGNLPRNIKESDIKQLFNKRGSIADIDLKMNSGWDRERSGAPYAFVDFHEMGRDAEYAIRELDGCDYNGYIVRVKFARDPSSSYRCIVHGLPSTGSLQDLKYHMRKYGDVCHAYIHKDGTGVVEFVRPEDMEYALRYLNGTEFISHKGDYGSILVEYDQYDLYEYDPTSRSGGDGGGGGGYPPCDCCFIL